MLLALVFVPVYGRPGLGAQVFDCNGRSAREVLLGRHLAIALAKLAPTYAIAVGHIVDLDGQMFARDGLVRDGQLSGCRPSAKFVQVYRPVIAHTFRVRSAEEISFAWPEPKPSPWTSIASASRTISGVD